MNIAYLSTFYPFRGGIAQFNALLYREFSKRHTVTAYTFSRQYPGLLFPGQTQYVTANDNADKIPAQAVLDTVNPVSYVTAARTIARSRPDLLVMKFWMPFFAPSLGHVAGRLRRGGARVISILDNVIPHERRFGDLSLIRYFLKRNDAYVVMSRTVEKDLRRLKPDARYRLKAHPLYDHYAPRVDMSAARRALGLPEEKRLVLFFGFIRGYKGLDLLLECLPFLDESIHVVVAGEVYGSFAEYDRIIERHRLKHRVSLFTRYIDDPEVPLFFSACDVCVLPYKSATQSGIVQIAYHYDLPAIVTDVGGLSEMVVDGDTGLILKEADPVNLAGVIRRFFDEKLGQRMSDNIRSNRPLYSWSGFADTIEHLYGEIA